jgi:Ion channel
MAVFLKKFQQFWAHEKSLTVLLFILVIHIFIIIPFGQNTALQRILFLFFYILLLSAGLLFITQSKNLRIILILVLALSVLFGSGILFESVTLELWNNLIVVVYCILMCWIVLVRTFSEGPITIHRIQGAIVTYLLIGFIFSVLYHSFYLIEGDAAFKGLGSFDRKELMYFSLTTLTTVGYGDITPAVASTRSLANMESLIGQLYPAILIARLVVMEYESSRKR